MDKNDGVYKWFSSHPLFSINGMCKLIKIDTSNFTRYLASGKIPEKYIEPIENILSNYGYFGQQVLNTEKGTTIINPDNGLILQDFPNPQKPITNKPISQYPLEEKTCTPPTDPFEYHKTKFLESRSFDELKKNLFGLYAKRYYLC